jgi:N-acetylmuramoyl-L-alanine amidase
MRRLIIHAADTPATMDIGAAEIDRWHREKGWAAIGYHHVIRRDGTIEKGRDLDGDGDVTDEVGAHAYGFNKDSIGICLVGGKPDFNFTRAQMKSLDFLVGEYESRYPEIEVLGHRDLPGVDKPCPTYDVRAWYSRG